MPVWYHQTRSAPLTKSPELLLPPGAMAMSDSGMFATLGGRGTSSACGGESAQGPRREEDRTRPQRL